MPFLSFHTFLILTVVLHCSASNFTNNDYPSEIVASEKDVTNCMNALNAAAVCSLGPTQQPSCCAAIENLDYYGCFCEAIFENLLIFEDDLINLRDDILPICIPEESTFRNISQCPSRTLLHIQQECHANNLIGRRLASIRKLGETLDKIEDLKLTTYEEFLPYFSDIFHEDMALYVSTLGVFSGIESALEYFVLSLRTFTNDLWYRSFSLLQDWKLFEDGSLGVQTETEWVLFKESTTRWSRDSNLFEFGDCDDKILKMTMITGVNYSELLSSSIQKGQPWSVENHVCPSIMEHCSDPSLNVSEFKDLDSCITFQRSLPTFGNCNGDVSGYFSALGNSLICKWKHSFLVPFRPHHHCPHTGTGNLADDKGKFLCVQEDCSLPISVFDDVKDKLSIVPDLSQCKLNAHSGLLLHLSSLVSSGCSMSIQVLDEIFDEIPTEESLKSLQALCQPYADNKEVCHILRFNLQAELNLLLHHCGGELPESSLPSLRQILRAAYDLGDFQELVCLAREDSTAENKVCQACTQDDLTSLVPLWVNSDTGERNEEDGDAMTMITSKFCRQTLHFACSNQHGRLPDFCNICFMTLDTNSQEGNNDSCLHSLTHFWNDYCNSATDAELPRWFNENSYVDPYPGANPPSDTTEHDLESHKVFDFIIIGAGNSGCVVARRLSDAGYSVLVLEDGVDWQKERDAWDISRKRRQVLALWETPMAKKFISKPNKKLLGRTLDIVLGRTLGGSTGINAGLYSRPAQEEFDLYWPDKWKSKDVLPFFKMFENYHGPTNAIDNHGTDGLLTVQPPSHAHTYSSAWLKAAEQATINVVIDGSSGLNNESGVYRLQQTWKDGRRQDAFTSYLLPIMPRDGLEVRSGANVAKIIFEEENGKQTATGVIYQLQGLARVTVHARREIIVSAGWAGSPKLLMMSGIGPKDNLEKFDIKVEVPLEGVGQQLVGRPLMNLLFGGQRITPEEMPLLFTSQGSDIEWALNGTGVLDMAIEDIYGKEKSGLDDKDKTDFLMSFSNILGSSGNIPLQTLFSLCKVCRPKSRGFVQLQSPNPYEVPEVSFDMLGDDYDMDILVACVKKTLSVYRHFRFQDLDLLGLHEMKDTQLRELLRAQVIFSYHAWGSCRMGDGPLDVVEPDGLRVRGFANLRVIDGSVMPEGPCSGPMATTYMLAERGAAFILGDLSKEHIPGAHVVDKQQVFIIVVSVLFVLMLILAATTRIAAAVRVKRFSKILQQPEMSTRRQSTTTAFVESSEFAFHGGQERSISDLSIHYSTLTLDRLPGGSRTIFNATGEIKKGELTLLMGTSGAGKSTLLDILSMRFQSARIDGGLIYSFHDKHGKKVVLSGANPNLQAFMRRNIAYCKQSPDDLVEQLTVLETLLYSYMLRVAPSENSRFSNISMVQKIINSVGLTGHEHKTARKLSGGQKRMLQIGASLLDNPMAIFMDEPTSGLDQNTSLKIIYLMKKIAKSRNIPVVAAIHHPGRTALENSDNLTILFQGHGVFQGNYEKLKEVVSVQGSYQPDDCPLSYTFDTIGIDDDFRKEMFDQHISTFNTSCLPDIQKMLQQAEADDSNLDKIIVSNQLPMGSMLDNVVTLLTLFIASMGSKRSTMERLLHFGRIHTSGLSVFALGVLLPALAGEQLPIKNTGDIITFFVLVMVFISAAISVFHVSVGLDLVENGAKHFYILLFERLISPAQLVVFWILQGFLIVFLSLPGYAIFYYWLGFRKEFALESILLFFVYCIQAVAGVQMIQLCFPGPAAPGVYGVYAALQLLLGGPLPSQDVRNWLQWTKYVNPMSYYFRTLLCIEAGVGRNVECNENCRFLLDLYDYKNVDLFWNGMFLFGVYIVQLGVIYVKLSMELRSMDQSGDVQSLTSGLFKEQAIENISTIRATEFDNIDARRLFKKAQSRKKLLKEKSMNFLKSVMSFKRSSTEQSLV